LAILGDADEAAYATAGRVCSVIVAATQAIPTSSDATIAAGTTGPRHLNPRR
jgi:hypothetical protein